MVSNCSRSRVTRVAGICARSVLPPKVTTQEDRLLDILSELEARAKAWRLESQVLQLRAAELSADACRAESAVQSAIETPGIQVPEVGNIRL